MKAKLRRDNTFQKCSRSLRDRLARGSKVETFEDLEKFLSHKKSKAQEEEQQWSLDHSMKDKQSSDLRQGA
jgi:hypothetical protein